MSVPSHNLYDFVHQVTEKRFWPMYFYPWGDKDMVNLIDHFDPAVNRSHLGIHGLDSNSIVARKFLPDKLLNYINIRNFQPILLCHDQEPLNFNLYSDDSDNMINFNVKKNLEKYPIENQNLRSRHCWSWQKKWVLLHSEKNSAELDKYESTGRYQGAFWWSHAVLARDWYRYAEYDQSLSYNKTDKTLFLIYARAHTGTRQYRKTFLSMIQPIEQYCQIGSVDSIAVDSSSSAVYNSLDMVSTDISIVLETLFTDDRIHLTEKILRPIACGHPFILAAGSGSLKFLKSYGFETFSPWINELYDTVQDHDQRLQSIIDEMQRIATLSKKEKQLLIVNCQQIAQRNKQRFFSKEFYSQVVNELAENVRQAHDPDNYTSDFWVTTNLWRSTNDPDHFNTELSKQMQPYHIPMICHMRQNNGSLEQYQRHEHCLDDKSSTNGNDV
jgi:hypothetical protein